MLTFEDIDIMTFDLRNFPQCEEGLVSFLFTWDCSQKSQAQIRLQINMGWTVRTHNTITIQSQYNHNTILLSFFQLSFFQLSQETF